jgi:long-chain acyl-CoA synthetase
MSTTDRPWLKHYGPKTQADIDPNDFKNVPQMLKHAASKFGRKRAFTTCMPNGMNGSLSFEQVDRKSDAFALYLREKVGLKPGDRVIVQTPNCLSYPIAAFGILKAGCVLVNTNPLYTVREMQHQFSDSGAKAIVIINMFTDKLQAVLKQHSFDEILISRVSDFFTAPVGRVIDLILKYWNQQVPASPYKDNSFEQAVRWGEKNYDRAKLEGYSNDISPDTLAVLQYTGGTTGVSKGAMLSHLNLMANMKQIFELIGKEIEEGKETVMTALPLYHIFAFTVNLMGFFTRGGHNILIPNPRPLSNLKRAFENYPITWLPAVNTLLNALTQEVWFCDSPPKTLKAAVAGGMALQEAVAIRWTEVTGTPVTEGYGLTEASPVISFNPFHGLKKSNSIGIPVPSTFIRLELESGEIAAEGEPGELCCYGPQVMLGYWNQPEETAKTLSDGWLKTGDIAVFDEDGYLKIVDRKKDMIVVSGFNVYPNEVEDCLVKHPAILEAAVIGISDEKTTEAVKAFIVLKSGADIPQVTDKEIIAHCKELLTAYKLPKVIEFRSDLPKSPVGKILRKELRREV